MARIYVVGTADTKGEELAYLAGVIRAAGGDPLLVDVGTREPTIPVDIGAREVAGHHPKGAEAALGTDDRGTAVAAMSEAFSGFAASRNDIAGMIGLGGGGGTAIITAGMRRLPYGVPKVMVSTLASGDTAPYVDVSDIIMMPSVTDIAGLNRLSRVILHNAGQAIAAMTANPARKIEDRPAIGLTMFGVTTPCVTAIAERLRGDYDCMIFHATGTGGRTMESLADGGLLAGAIDITTTEICDFLFGGVLPATGDRLGAIARTGIPYVGSVGALDMVNFWGPDSVPVEFRQRLLHRHNPQVTLMRTTVDENRRAGTWIADKLNRCEGPVRLLIPEKGVSAMDAPGEAFHDPAADAALVAGLETNFKQTERRRLIRLPLHINDPAFSTALVENFREIAT